LHEGGDPPHEWLALSTPTDHDTLHLDWTWLSDEVLESVLFEARQAAGFSQRQLIRFWDTIQTDKRTIRLAAANGHTDASIAELMGTTEGTIRNCRQRIRRLLEHLLPPDTFIDYDRSGGNHQRAREIQSTYPDRRKPMQV
jgi:hypothetical protein